MPTQPEYQLLTTKSDEEGNFHKDCELKDRHSRRFRLGLFIFLAIITLFALFPAPEETQATDAFGAHGLEKCVAPVSPTAHPPAPINLWAPLTVSEITEIQKWLEAPERQLNITRGSDSHISDNTIFLIEVYYPPKVDALAYLAGGSAPEKRARVTIQHGGLENSVIRNYLVGPLPVGQQTTISALTDIYHESEIPFNARGYINIEEMTNVFKFITPEMSDALQACIVLSPIVYWAYLPWL